MPPLIRTFHLDWTSASANGTTTLTDAGGRNVDATVSTPANAAGKSFILDSTVWPDDSLRIDRVAEPVTARVDFSTPVENLTFELYDVDSGRVTDNFGNTVRWDDRVTVEAFDRDGNLVPVTFSELGAFHSVDGNRLDAFGADDTAVDGPGAPDSVTVTIPSSIVSLRIVADHGSSAGQTGTIGISDIQFAATPPDPDGIVDGTSDGELIDLAYDGDPEGDRVDAGDAIFGNVGSDDDIIDALGGNDTVEAGAGDDTVEAGSGDDLVTGGSGDDVLRGDSVYRDGAPRESFEWDRAPGFADDAPAGAFVQDTGTVEVSFSFTEGAPGSGSSYETSTQNVDGIQSGEESVDAESSLSAGSSGVGDADTYRLDFSAPVTDMSFRINDVDGDGLVAVFAYDADGGRVPVRLDAGSRVTLRDSDGDGEDDTADSNGGYRPEADERHSVLVSVPGPVSRLEIVHSQDGPENSSINVTDVYFDAPPPVPEGAGGDTLIGQGGDDLIDGGAGDDSLLGGAGDDSLRGGRGDDTLVGGRGDDILAGGLGADVMRGGDDRDTFRALGPGDNVFGGAGGDDFDTLDLRGSLGGGSYVLDGVTPDSDGNGIDGRVIFRDAGGDETGRLDFENIERIIPCFTPGTLIATPQGERRVEDLREGDRVITRDNGIQAIRWVGSKELGSRDLLRQPALRPVLIRAGALGHGLPERDMLVSPNHRVLVANDLAALYFEDREVLVAAKHLALGRDIVTSGARSVRYLHLLFDRHEVILSNGAWTESFQPGDYTMNGIDEAQRREILALFPELKEQAGIRAFSSARKSLKKHEARLLTG